MFVTLWPARFGLHRRKFSPAYKDIDDKLFFVFSNSVEASRKMGDMRKVVKGVNYCLLNVTSS
jgi:hypothetical protein